MANTVDFSPLGKTSDYPEIYDPQILYPIARQINRDKLNIQNNNLPFYGIDIWNAYELSWLDSSGKPQVYVAKFYIPCDSDYLIESKSFKLYLNSFNNTIFQTAQEVENLLTKDLSKTTNSKIKVELTAVNKLRTDEIYIDYGICIDNCDVTIDCYNYNFELLTENKASQINKIKEVLHTNILKSNCPVTGQPDWGTLIVDYQGEAINHSSLFKYICSLRNHQEFHEMCVERIFLDLLHNFDMDKLIVGAQYLRRGGLDINPWRTKENKAIKPMRFIRQ